MVLPDGLVKVLDFGLARYSVTGRESNITVASGLRAGTFRYMSPEHSQNEPVTAQSDIFALGIVLYELGAGQHPFTGDSPLEVLDAIATEEAVPPSRLNPAISSSLSAAILRMMAKEPAARPDAATVAALLNEIGNPLEAAQIAVAPKARWLPNRMRLLAGTAFLVAALATAAWYFYPSFDGFKTIEQVTTLVPDNHATAAAISGDGKFLAYANVDGIFLRTLGSEEEIRLPGPRLFTADQLAWFPDDTRLIASGFSEETNRNSIWLLSITSGPARELRSSARLGTPSPDGSRIAFLDGDYSTVWTMTRDGQDQRRLVSGPGADSFTLVTWSAAGRHVLFQRRHYSGQQELGFVSFEQHYERSFESASADTGHIVDKLANFAVRSAVSQPTGELFFLGGARPGAQGEDSLWTTMVDPGSGKFGRRFKQLTTPLEKAVHFSMSATRDGSEIVLVRQQTRASVFVADLHKATMRLSNIRELTLDRRASYPHAWTADSNAVIFESDRSGGYDLFMQGLDQRVPETLVSTPVRWEVTPQLSPNGKFVLFASGPAEGGAATFALMSVPVGGGQPTQLTPGGAIEEFRCSSNPKGRCVVKKTIGRSAYAFFEADPVGGLGPELVRTAWLPSSFGDWDISPDGQFLAIPNHDLKTARIRIVPLGEKGNKHKEHEIELAGLANLSGVAWTADQSGWFVSVDSFSSVGKRMYYAKLDGQLMSLGAVHGWAVPSPDGKKVAYLNQIHDSNAWMLRRN